MNFDKKSLGVAAIIVFIFCAGIWAVFGAKGIDGPVIDYNKVAVASDGDTLDSPTSKYFGRAPYFIVYNMNKDTFWVLPNPFFKEQHATGLRSSAMIAKKTVGVVIAQNIGPEPCKNFNNYGIKMYLGASGRVRDAIVQYRNGELVLVNKPNVPTHYGLKGAKPCPSFLGQPKARIAPADMAGQNMNPVPPVAAGGRSNIAQAAWQQPNNAYYVVICPFCGCQINVSQSQADFSSGIICPRCQTQVNWQTQNQYSPVPAGIGNTRPITFAPPPGCVTCPTLNQCFPNSAGIGAVQNIAFAPPPGCVTCPTFNQCFPNQAAAQQAGFGSPAGIIVCPSCGYSRSKQMGVPTYSISCPQCGGRMVRAQ